MSNAKWSTSKLVWIRPKDCRKKLASKTFSTIPVVYKFHVVVYVQSVQPFLSYCGVRKLMNFWLNIFISRIATRTKTCPNTETHEATKYELTSIYECETCFIESCF